MLTLCLVVLELLNLASLSGRGSWGGGVSKLPLTFVLCVECHQHIDLEEGNIIKIHKHDRQLRMLPIRLVRVPS